MSNRLAAGWLLVLGVTTSSIALAAWTASEAGPTNARSATVNGATGPTATVAGDNVSLTWSAVTLSTGDAVTGYRIKRYDSLGVTEQGVSSGSCASTVTGTSCTHTSVPPGTWTYSVTPLHNNWVGAESNKTPVTVERTPSLTLGSSLVKSPSTLSGSISQFAPGETMRFRLDSATGTELAGTVDGSATPAAVPSTGSASITVQLPSGVTEGAHSIYAVASPSGDNASATITVDNTAPPPPTITAQPPNPTSATTADFTFSDTESGVRFECQIDTGGYSACTSPKSYTGLPAGSHTFGVRALDAAGNQSAAASYTWTIDTSAPPPPSITSSPASVTTSRDASFAFTDAEAGVTFRCQLDSGGFSDCTSPKGYSALADGSRTFEVKAVDAAGNQSLATSHVWRIDTIAPTGAQAFPVAESIYDQAAWTAGCGTPSTGDLCGTAADVDGSGVTLVQVSIFKHSMSKYWGGTTFNSNSEKIFDAMGTTTWSYDIAATSFAQGNYTIKVFVTDGAGNQSTFSTSFSINGTIVYRVNAGGPRIDTAPYWSVDTSETPSRFVNSVQTNSVASTTNVIDMTHASIPSGTPEALFKDDRWDSDWNFDEMQWDFPVTAGSYTVRLYFAETYWATQSVGARLFDVTVEGAVVLDNYDIYAEVGANKAVMKSFTVTSDSNLDIDFLHVTQNPKIEAIEIIKA